MKDSLEQLLFDMDIPSLRRTDLRWLSGNLGIRNSTHRNYAKSKYELRTADSMLLKRNDLGISVLLVKKGRKEHYVLHGSLGEMRFLCKRNVRQSIEKLAPKLFKKFSELLVEWVD